MIPMALNIRRKFVDVHVYPGSPLAGEAIKRIAGQYEIGKKARGKPPPDRAALRQAQTKPNFDDLEDLLGAQLTRISGKSPLAAAIH